MSRSIYVISPSSAVRDRAAVRRGIRRLQALGHRVELDSSAYDTHMRFAGDDDARAAAVHRAAASGADLVLTTRGGYGLTRILPLIDQAAIAASVARGTQWVGLSDFTALQLGMFAKTKTTSWAGPALGEDFGAESPDETMLACFDDLCSGAGEGTGWRLPAAEGRGDEWHVRGTLWGGNLCVATALLGTPWMPRVKGGILFFEDVSEHPYRIERMLTQWLHAGILDRQAAIVLGAFTRFQKAPNDKGFGLPTVVAWLRQHTTTPIFTGLPFGHVPTKVMLPIGRRVDFLVQGRDALILWGHSHASEAR